MYKQHHDFKALEDVLEYAALRGLHWERVEVVRAKIGDLPRLVLSLVQAIEKTDTEERP